MSEESIFLIAAQAGVNVEYGAAEVLLAAAQASINPDYGSPEILLLGVQVAHRADRAADGSRISIAATSDAEEPQVVYTDIVFPECISYGSTGSPRYVTDKVEVASGAEQRNSRFAYPKHKYEILLENIPADEIAKIMNIWHVCSGDYSAFLFMDPLDHTSAWSDTQISGTTVGLEDQFIASAIAGQTDYQIIKTYKYESREKKRLIRYPKDGTLRVAVNGFEVFNWSYSYTSQVLRFTTAPAVTANMSRTAGGLITGGNYSNFKVGDLVSIQGWSDSNYNASGASNPARVTQVNATEIVVEKFNGTAYGSDALGPESVTIEGVLPPTGSDITAGYYFYVPVRFDDGDNAESEVKAGMRESAIATFDRVTLTEVFE